MNSNTIPDHIDVSSFKNAKTELCKLSGSMRLAIEIVNNYYLSNY